MVYGSTTHTAASGDAVFTTGSFEGPGSCGLTVDPSGTNLVLSGTNNVGYVSRFSTDGQHQWTYAFNSSNFSAISDIASDAAGNGYILGVFSGTMDIDPGNDQTFITSSGTNSYFLVKLSPTGQLVWYQTFNNQATPFYNANIAIRSNAVYIAGNYNGTVDFDNSSNVNELTAQDIGDCFVLKLNTEGVFQWVRSYGSANNTLENYESIADIAVGPNGDILISGIFYVPGDFNPGPGETQLTTVGASDGYLIRMTSNGDYIWAKSSGIQGEEINSRISFTSDGSIYNIGTTGEYTQNTANEDIYIRKLNESGNLEWSHQIGESDMEQGISLTVDNENHLYVCGDYSSQHVDFDPDATEVYLPEPNSSPHPYIARFTPDGQLDRIFTHDCQIGSAFGISYANGALYYTGYFFDSIDMDPGTATQWQEATNSFAGSYLVKIDTTALPLGISIPEITDFYLFPNPAENQLTIQLLAQKPDAVLRLITLQGIVLQTENVSADQLQLDVASLTSGVYLIELQSDKHKTIRQFVKK